MLRLPSTSHRLLSPLLPWKLLQRLPLLQLTLQLLRPRMPHLLPMLLQVLRGGMWVWVFFLLFCWLFSS